MTMIMQLIENWRETSRIEGGGSCNRVQGNSWTIAMIALTLMRRHWRYRPKTPVRKAWPPLGPPPIPADNPMTDEKIELGKMLFFDPILSGNYAMPCVGLSLAGRWVGRSGAD